MKEIVCERILLPARASEQGNVIGSVRNWRASEASDWRAREASDWRAREASDWRAREASETPSIATYRKKCLGVSTSKPQCACPLFYVKREEWTLMHLREACLLFASAIYNEKLALRTSKRKSACTSNNFTFARPLMGTIF